MRVYQIDSGVQLEAVFRDATGALIDPDVVTCEVRLPVTRKLESLIAVRETVGLYRAGFSCSQIGTHFYRFQASGNVEVANEGSFKVVPSAVE